MKNILIFLMCLFLGVATFAQKGFQFENDKRKVEIPFQLINNLIFIPIQVNGVELTFLLDTGVQTTIIFSLEDKDVNINNIEKIKLSGLGGDEPIEALKSNDNILSVNGLVDIHHEMYIIISESFNFSSHVGIPVNGIIGYHFFEENLIEINYIKKKITVYKSISQIEKKLKQKFTSIPIYIEKFKPYVNTFTTIDKKKIQTKLLLDVGNSDALWLFQDINNDIKVPENNFQDYLGQGFSGGIFGKRTRISKFNFDKFEFNNLIIAMPDSSSIKSLNMVQDRVGSIGGGIFKRFLIVFDYKHNQMFLRKNHHFNDPFQYNLSGIEIHNDGVEWINETISLKTSQLKFVAGDENETYDQFQYKFNLKPIYSIVSVRENAPADISGLKRGDVIKKINSRPIYKYSLEKINEILKSEDGKWINLEIERNGVPMKFKFQLKNIL